MKGRVSAKDVNKRQADIVEIAKKESFVTVEQLTEIFSVTPQTIRKDINKLCEDGLLRRYHGGVTIASSVENVDYNTRQTLHHEVKRKIGALLASHIPNHSSLFINIGTTNEEVAKALLHHEGLRVVTNNMNVAAILSDNPDFEVMVAGGVVRQKDKAITGEATIDYIRQFKVDYGIIGISGIDENGILLDFDYQEVRVTQAIIENSGKVFLATDSSKFGNSAMVRLGSISCVDAVFTEQMPPEKYTEALRDFGVDIFVVPEDGC